MSVQSRESKCHEGWKGEQCMGCVSVCEWDDVEEQSKLSE